MSAKLQAVRGMHDILPEESIWWRNIEGKITNLLDKYGYQEIRLPIVEKTELFRRSIGEQTDIVSKEMYVFEDRNGDSLTLRPEGTASCVRAGLEHGLFHNKTQRLWYAGPMFRYERPQKGRQRQFHQVGVEAFGFEGPDIDAELILLSARLFSELNLPGIELQLNSLGTVQSRCRYCEVLVDYFSKYQDDLDEDSQRQLRTNPLRILDNKNPHMEELINAAPVTQDYLDKESAMHFEQLRYILDNADVKYKINTRLVRGLDYYSHTVFEWISSRLGAQSAVCAGGRYNNVVEHFGGKPTPAIGFALGIERLMTLVKVSGNEYNTDSLVPHVYLVLSGEQGIVTAGMELVESLRDQLPWLKIISHCGGGSFKSQFKCADKSGALLALVMGSEEIKNRVVGLKHLRDKSEQQNIPVGDISKILTEITH